MYTIFYVRVDQRVQSWGVLIVKGVGEEGHREILRVETGNSEHETTWAQVFQQLWERGLRGVVYGVSDEHPGLRATVARYFQGLGWQRCQVHYQRKREAGDLADWGRPAKRTRPSCRPSQIRRADKPTQNGQALPV